MKRFANYALLVSLCVFAALLSGGFLFKQPARVHAAPFAGPVTINGTDYATLKAAFDAINSGTHQGAINILISGNTTETVSAVLNASGSGSANYTSINVVPTSAAPHVISGDIAGPLVDLNGADNVTIQGLLAVDALILSNTSTSSVAGTSTIRFRTDASNNNISFCTVLGSATMTAPATSPTEGGTILFSTGTTTGNDNNRIATCNIGPAGTNPPVYGIYSAGTTSSPTLNNSGNVVDGNNIYDFYHTTSNTHGLRLAAGSTGWTISGNSFYWTVSRTGSGGGNTARAISLEAGNGHVVTGNFIGGSAPNAGGTPWTINVSGSTNAYVFAGIRLDVLTTTAASVQGNTITNFDWKSSSASSNPPGVWCGIYVSAGNVDIGTVTGNTIGSGTGTGAVSVASSGIAYSYGINSGSSGTVNILNNTIGSITTGGLTTAGAVSNTVRHGFAAIETNAGNNTITNNTLGSTSTANSINASSAAVSDGQALWGINCASSGTNVITGNTVANLNNNYTGSDNSFRQTTVGILSRTGTNTITGNTVRNLTTAATMTSKNELAALAGLVLTATAGNQTVAQNVVHSLTSTTASAGTQIYGIHYSGPTTGTNLVARNFVHSLAPAAGNANSVLKGINTNGGLTTYQNNMVRLGIKADGSAITTNNIFEGIYEEGGTNNFYYNTVYLGGTGGGFIYAFNSNLGSPAREIRNNIFLNPRASGLAGGAARYNPGTPFNAGFILSNNLYQSGSIGIITNGALSPASLQTWQRTGNQDAGSATVTLSQINLVNATGDASTVDLHVQSPTAVEGAGFNVASVTDDFDGQTRSTLTPVDIGADAVNATGVDVFPPAISFTALGNTGSTANRTLTATITDTTGVPTTGALVPRVYYRKNNTGSYFSQPGTLTSGTATNGTWDFIINNTDMGGVAPGNLISYYILAQDTASPININSQVLGAEGTNVNTVTTHPFSPNGYRIRFAGTVNVGTGQAYTTLTNSGGVFDTINLSGLSGNTTINITSDLTGEGGGTTLNQWVEEGAGNYTLTIRPSGGAARLVSGNASGAGLLAFNGADRVTIDGLNSGGNALTIRNINPGGQTLAFSNDASQNTVQNCTVEGNAGNGATNAVILIGTGTTTGNDNITITNNTIRDRSDTTGVPFNLIYSQGTSNTVSNSNITISNNQLFNFTSTGIWAAATNSANDNWTISGNTIYQTAARTTALAGINFSAAGTNTISQNVIRDLDSSQNKQGIALVNAANTTVARNRIYNFSGANALYGIEFVPGLGATANVTLVNNMITLNPPTSASQTIMGIRVNNGSASSSSLTANYNSVLIAGTATGTATQALRIESTVFTTTLRNNILFNARSGGSVAHYALDRATSNGTLNSNYNLLFGTGSPTAANFLRLVNTDHNLTTWRTSSGTPDVNSIDGQAAGLTPAVFVNASNGDLHVLGAQAAAAAFANLGTNIAGVTTDYDGETRHASRPDIGADEFGPVIQVEPPTAMTFCPPGRVYLGFTPQGTGPYTYQWRKNGFNLTNNGHYYDTDNNQMFITGVQPGDSGSYDCIVSDTTGTTLTGATTLNIPTPPTVSPTTLSDGTLNVAYTPVQFTVTGGVAPYTFTIRSGALPGGMSLSTSGVLSGTPNSTGLHTFRLNMLDSGGCGVQQDYTLNINGTGGCPIIELPTPTNIPFNAPYSFDFAPGMIPAGTYTFADGGGLPAGITRTGSVLSGTATAAIGNYPVTFTATSVSQPTCSAGRLINLKVRATAVSLALQPDYDGDGKGELVTWSTDTGEWLIRDSSTNALRSVFWGQRGDVPVLGDYDDDGLTDIAVFRPANGTWYIRKSSDGAALVRAWGASGDTPVPGDFDGDGVTDLAVWRGAEGRWLIRQSSNGATRSEVWGAGYAPYNDVALAGDYDGDGKSDLAVFRHATGTWYIKQSRTGGVLAKAWGLATDVPVPHDYDNDGLTDIAVWRGDAGLWLIFESRTQQARVEGWGTALTPFNDVAAPADYDGDGLADVAVYRASDRTWYISNSRDRAARIQSHGQTGATPVTAHR